MSNHNRGRIRAAALHLRHNEEDVRLTDHGHFPQQPFRQRVSVVVLEDEGLIAEWGEMEN
jgi:hypothetical protein